MSSRSVVRKSDIGAPPSRMSSGAAPARLSSGAPPARLSSGAPPSRLSSGAPPSRMSSGAPPILPSRRGAFRGVGRKRRIEENLDPEDSDTDQTSTAEDQEDNDSTDDVKRDNEQTEKVKRTRKKRRFRLTDSVAKSRKKAERRAQLAAERKERDQQKQAEGEDVGKSREHTPSPPPLPKQPSVRTYSPFQLFSDHILRKLQFKDVEEYFAYPVTASMAPDYHELISEPMDFSTMRKKIENDEYMDIISFKKDVELIVNNALTYNHPGTIYHIAAQRLNQIMSFYFSEQSMRYLYHTLPFSKEISLETLDLTLKVRARPVPKRISKVAIVDNATPSAVLDSADKSIKHRLSNRVPNLTKILPDCTNGTEPKCHLAFLDNKNGTVCLNVINPAAPETKLTLSDLIGKLQEGNPGLCAPQELKSNAQVPITYLSYGPFSSFAPQFDSTWATLCERDSRLLLSTYGDKESVINAVSLRKMVEDSSEHLIKMVDDLLDTLTDGEHQRVITALENSSDEKTTKSLDNVDMEDLLKDVETLENLGIDVSFVSDIRKQIDLENESKQRAQDTLNSTGTMINDLMTLQKNRMSGVPPITLTDQPAPNLIEVNLAHRVRLELQNQILQFAKPGDVISPPVIHNAVGLNEEDLDLLNEFFTVPTTGV